VGIGTWATKDTDGDGLRGTAQLDRTFRLEAAGLAAVGRVCSISDTNSPCVKGFRKKNLHSGYYRASLTDQARLSIGAGGSTDI